MVPECNLGSNIPYKELIEGFLPALLPYYSAPSDFSIDPFQIYGNLYYVGDKKVCMHLVDTGDGLILFDSGYRHTLHLLLESIRKLGFHPEDVKYIIHSHGHFDHFGGGNEMRKMYGSKVFMSRIDTELIRERPDRALMQYGPAPYDDICWPDQEIEDGNVITLGNTSVRCVSAPGHTLGTMAFFFEAFNGSERKNVGYLGGLGFLSVYREYCREYGLPENKCELIEQSVCRLWDENVDIVLGNHPNHNCTLEKRAWELAHPEDNPFVNTDAWHIFLSALRARKNDFVALGY